MNPAIQYLTRTQLIKSWFNLPCSIFLEENISKNNPIIITINKAKTDNELKIKKWFLNKCLKEYILPPFNESIISTADLFSHPSVIVNGHKPFYKAQSISSRHNGLTSPMPEELYNLLFQNAISGEIHNKCRQIWLWEKFIKIYLPAILTIGSQDYDSEDEFVVGHQMKIVENHFQKIWQSWEKWTNYFLLPTPGEIIFCKEYGTL